jgi:hypothetical protein
MLFLLLYSSVNILTGTLIWILLVVVVPCRYRVYRRCFGDFYCIHLQGEMSTKWPPADAFHSVHSFSRIVCDLTEKYVAFNIL